MRMTTHPVSRGIVVGLLAMGLVIGLEFAPQRLVAYGQTAGPTPTAIPLPPGVPPASQTAISTDPPSSCTVLNGSLSALGGGNLTAQCDGSAVLGIKAPGGSVPSDGTLSLMVVGQVLGGSSDCTGANQLPILATQHFLSIWNRPGQPPSMDLGKPASIQLPIAASILAKAGGDPNRVLILHSLPDGTVTPIPVSFNGSGNTASFQSSRLGDFYAIALPAGLPATYGGKVGNVNFANHTFTLSGANGQIAVQSYDRQGGTTIVHSDGGAGTFAEIPNAPSVNVEGVPSPASCGKTNGVVAKQITLGGPSGAVVQIPGTAQLPNQLPSTGMGGTGQP